MKATTEKAFEAYIQETMAVRGWISGSNQLWDKAKALFPDQVIAFIKETQADLWAQMEKLHGRELSEKLIEALVKERSVKGTLHIIRHGFKFYGKIFKLAYFKPAHGLVQETLELFSKNQLHVTRQIACHPFDFSTMDMVLSLNGIPLATMELKNPATGQTWKHAISQYKSDRDPRAPLFQFIRGAVVPLPWIRTKSIWQPGLTKKKLFSCPSIAAVPLVKLNAGKAILSIRQVTAQGIFRKMFLNVKAFWILSVILFFWKPVIKPLMMVRAAEGK